MRAFVLLGAAAGLLVMLAAGADASTSCQSFFSQCSARCVNNAKGESKAKCTADHCSPKLASCRQSGCWTEGNAYGGGTTCNLKKS
jgi:hypothetical protein